MRIFAKAVFILSLFVCICPDLDAWQEPQEQASLREKIVELTKQLDADKEADRDAAEKEIQQIGPEALEFLPPLDEQASAELRMRIERLREKFLEETTVDFHEPSMVNLVGEMSVVEALDRIEKQTRNKIGLDAYRKHPALGEVSDFDIQGVTYWEALDEVMQQIDWQIIPRDNGKIAFGPKPQIPEDKQGLLKSLPRESIPPVYIGVLRLQPVALSKTTHFLDPLQSTAELDFIVQWEPRFNPVFVRFAMDKLVVRTENDELLLVPTDQSSDYVPVGSQLLVSMRVLKPTQAATKIASWKGQLQIAIPGRTATIDFENPKDNSGKTLTAGDMTVVLESASKNRDLQEIQIGVSLANQPSNDVLQGWIALTDGYLIDKEGNRIEHAGWATTRLTKNDIGLSYLFDIEGSLSDYRFVYRAPESVILQTVDYEFNNIPFP
ncbi:MAG: hypothetical protein ACK6AT_13885 [Planctomycetota bacterium]